MRSGRAPFRRPPRLMRERMWGGAKETDMTDQLANTAPPLPETPRIYVACLAAYNNGCLHGRWIDVTTPDEIWDAVRATLAA